jgi:hypothetical protein
MTTYRIPSKTTPGQFYQVTVGLDGELQCNCPAAFNNLECWHVRRVREEREEAMSETTALVPIKVQPPAALLPTEHEMHMIDRAAALALSGAIALPKELNTQEKVAAVMHYGREMGVAPFTALRHLYVVNGRVQLSTELMLGIAEAAEPDLMVTIVSLTDTECTMRIIRPARELNAEYTVTWAEIEKAGLSKSDMNAKYPRDRLRYHATKRLLRAYAPDLINGLEGATLAAPSGEDEPLSTEDLYNEGDVIEGEYSHTPEPESEPEAQPITPKTRQQLIDLYHLVRDKAGNKAFMEKVRPLMADLWPHVFLHNSNALNRLSEPEAESVKAWLQGYLGEPAPDQACDHKPVYTLEEMPRLVCGKCGEELAEDAVPAGVAEE